jgi:hypothetical protein
MFDSEHDVIPMDLDQMEPGPFLAAILNSTDVDQLSGHDRVVALRAFQRMASHYKAQTLQAMASISDLMHDLDDDFELAHRSAATEIRAALTLTRRAAETELDLAIDTRQRLPQVWEALSRGDIDVRKAQVIVSTTCHLGEDLARSLADRIVARAPMLTTGQLRAAIAKLCLEADPEDAERVYEEAVEDRRMVLEANPTGTADLRGTDLPPDRAVAISRRINRLARRLKTEGETRSMDQLRADVFLDLLEGSLVGAAGDTARGVVDIQVDLETLMNLADSAGDLAGYGPVVADIARQVTERQRHSSWQFTVTDPDSGRPIHTGTTRRRPAAGQRRNVEARNRTCVFPGCRMPALDSDLDHRIPWSEGGATETCNLAPLCRHDHCNRHHCGWDYEPLANGDYRWISRLGHTYTTSGMPP